MMKENNEKNRGMRFPKELQARYDELISHLERMTKEERLSWFAALKPTELRFLKEIDGTTYVVRTVFRKDSRESLIEKTERLLMQDSAS